MNSKQSASWLPGYLAAGVVWGSSFLFIKVGLDALTPIGVAFFRCLIGGLTMLAYSAITKQQLPRRLADIGHLAVMALLLNVIPGFLFAQGETLVSSGTAGILNATTPLMTVLVMAVLFRAEKVNFGQFVGLLIGFVGVMLVVNPFADSGANHVLGVLELLAATFCYGISYPYSKRFVSSMPYNSTVLATTQVVCAAIILAPFALAFGTTHAEWNFEVTASMIVLGALGTGFAYIWNYRSVRIAGSAIASTVTYVTPVVAVALGAVLLGEPLGWIQLVGGMLVLLSAALVQQRIKLFAAKR